MRTKSASKRKRRPRSPAKLGALTAKLVKIGNSRGVRLPKAVIEQAQLSDEISLRVNGTQVILESAHPRAGWEEAFRKAAAAHGNELTQEDREWLDAPIDAEPDEWR